MTKLKRVLITAGGTGGHVFPGLAIADYLRERDIKVEWLGTKKGLESRIVPAAGIKLHYISITGLRGKGWQDIIWSPIKLFSAVLESYKIIKKFNPDVVVGLGGFVSGPGGIASFLLGKRLVIHEQNAKPGLTNKWLSKIAAKVLEGFPDTFQKSNKVVTIGNPVREIIAKLNAPEENNDRNKKPRLLVFGGSLGARVLNELIPEVLKKLPEESRPEVMHQTGKNHFPETLKYYQNAGIDAKILPFIDEMDKAYEWADVVLCRAGALTIAELCAAGRGAILVPYPYAVDDHQTSNANFMVNGKAAILIQQGDLTEERLTTVLKDICDSYDKRLSMAKAAFKLRRVDATEKVLNICEEVCN